MVMTESRLSIVIPIYNEDESLPFVLPDLIAYSERNGYPLILVDDGSTDQTPEILEQIAQNEFVEVINHRVNRGYGGALKTGILHANAEFTVTLDGDGQHNPVDIDALLRVASEEEADLVIGSRPSEVKGNPFRWTGKWIIRTFARYLMSMPVKDLNSGFKLYRTDLVKKYLELCPDSMAFSDIITLVFINQHHLVLEHPISVKERVAGKSTINLFSAFDTLVNVLNIAMMFNPLRFFLPLSFLCLLVGFGWGVPFIIMGRGVSVGSVLAIVTGLIFFVIGLVASQLAAIRLQLINSRQSHK